MNRRSFVYVKFPKTGLGNMLLLWARAVVFAKLNHLELVTSPWWGLRWGALVRREQKKRLYWKYFNASPVSKLFKAWYYSSRSNVVTEPEVKKLAAGATGNTLYLFNKIMTDYDLFGSIRNHQKIVTDELYRSLHPSKKLQLEKFEKPVIGIHVRRGDFKLGSIVTPLEFFIKGINIIRGEVGETWPVTVFTDADKDEIAELLALPSVQLAEEKADILDILLLSRSRVLLLSATSTFSYWAAFLSNGLVIRPANDWLTKIKDTANHSNFRDLKWNQHEAQSTSAFIEQINAMKEVTQ